MLDKVVSYGEAGGLMEWVNGEVGRSEVYFLWFPKTGRLAYAVRGPLHRGSGEVEAKNAAEAIAQAERLIRRLR